MEKVFDINLDIKRSTQALIGAVQYDNNTSILSITLTDENKPFEIPDGYDVELVFRRPDRKIFIISGEISIKGNSKILRFTLDASMLSVFGIADVEIRISKEEDVLTTGRFALEIRESLLSSGEEKVYLAKVNPIPVGKIESVFMGV